jgi:uncharacterized protein YdcH (DUF465 family)
MWKGGLKMLTCREVNEMLSLYIDGLLNENRKADFENHVNSCEACKRNLSENLKLVGMLHDLPEQELPDNFRQELHERLLQTGRKQKESKVLAFFRKPYYKVLSTAAAGILVVFLAKGLYDSSGFGLNKTANSAREAATAQTAQTEQASQFGVLAQKSLKSADQNSADLQKDMASATEQPSGKVQAKAAPDSSRADGLRGFGATSKNLPIINRNIEVLVYSDKPEEQADKIIVCAQDYDAQMLGREGELSLASSNIKMSLKAEIADEAAEKKAEDDSKSQSAELTGSAVVNFKIPDSRYEGFVNGLKDTLGSDETTFGTLNENDRSQDFADLKTRLKDVNDGIMRLSGNKSTADAEELENLKNDQLTILTEINTLEQDSQYIFVTIIVNEK